MVREHEVPQNLWQDYASGLNKAASLQCFVKLYVDMFDQFLHKDVHFATDLVLDLAFFSRKILHYENLPYVIKVSKELIRKEECTAVNIKHAFIK